MPKQNIRKLTKSSRASYSVLIPPEIIRDLGWRGKQKLVVERKGKKVVVKDWKK